jgi:hypothetical protein
MRLALYCRFSLRSPRVELWSLICATHPLVTAQPGRISLGKMLRRLVNAGISSQSPDHVIRNPVEHLLNDNASLKEIGVSMFWIALEESAEETSFSMSTFPPRWLRSARLKGSTYVLEIAMLLILADKDSQFNLHPSLCERFSVFTPKGRATRGQLGTTPSMVDLHLSEQEQESQDTIDRSQLSDDPEVTPENVGLFREMSQPTLKMLDPRLNLSEIVVDGSGRSDVDNDEASRGRGRRRHLHPGATKVQTDWEQRFRDKEARQEMGLAAGDAVAAFLFDDSSTVEALLGIEIPNSDRRRKVLDLCRRVVCRALNNFAKPVSGCRISRASIVCCCFHDLTIKFNH